jgi:hypothetical protein
MLPYQKLIYPCPFRGKETLEVIYRPSYKTAKISQSAAAGSKTTWRRMSEGIFFCLRNVQTVVKLLRRLKEDGRNFLKGK